MMEIVDWPTEEHWTVMVLDQKTDEIRAFIDMWGGFDKVAFASIQGAHNFVPSMLPKLWHSHHCCYTTPIYREAYYHGFYSAAAWYLIDRLASLAALPLANDMGSWLRWYTETHPSTDWKRVPGSHYFVEEPASPPAAERSE